MEQAKTFAEEVRTAAQWLGYILNNPEMPRHVMSHHVSVVFHQIDAAYFSETGKELHWNRQLSMTEDKPLQVRDIRDLQERSSPDAHAPAGEAKP
jgi:hypothetical protein